MDPQTLALLQALMQGSQGSNPNPLLGGLGPSGTFSSQPGQEAAQFAQTGESLQFPSELSPTGQNPNFQNTVKGIQTGGLGGAQMLGQMANASGRSGFNHQPATQGFSSQMSPPNPQSILNYLGMGNNG